MSGVRLLDMWESGLTFETQDERGELELLDRGMFVRCVSISDTKGSICGTDGAETLMVRLRRECTSTLDRFFNKFGLEYHEHITCPHCIGRAEKPMRIAFEDCLAFVLQDDKEFVCGLDRVSTRVLLPEVALGDALVFDAGAVQQEQRPFAAGGFGVIYRGVMASTAVVIKELDPCKAGLFRKAKANAIAKGAGAVNVTFAASVSALHR